jgi:peptidoglycan/xylan/chitin deacetylase (PgdA/CDA1 family)
MFAASHAVTFFDYFRVPYEVAAGSGSPAAPVGELWLADRDRQASPRLYWLRAAGHGSRPATGRRGRYELEDFTFFGEVSRDAAVPGLLAGVGGQWQPVTPIRGASGQPVAAIWQDSRRNIFLPFDPAEIMQQFWSEGYLRADRPALATAGRAAALRGYYLARPALPRPVQLRLRRAFTGMQNRPGFPRWPLETSLHDFYAWLFELIAGLTGTPVPYLGIWPDGRSWSMVLTHDVETADGQRQVELLRELERDRGLRSSWNFVGERYDVDPGLVRALQDEGCEVGVHGLRHDGRDLGSRRLMERRLPAMRQYARQWGAVGFRSPGTQRRWDLMPRLGFEYDSSYSDTDPYEPQAGGCCTYLPYFNQEMVELPITMPQDHTLFAILQQPDGQTWARKARMLRERGGMALVLTHPDYAGDRRVRDGYRAVLDEHCEDGTAWHALPREVADWWRSRAGSVVRRGSGLEVSGPAADRATVRFATADRPELWAKAS